jgi:hypothetical protein
MEQDEWPGSGCICWQHLLYTAWLEFCRASNSNRRLGRVVGRALQVSMLEATSFLLAAAWQREVFSLSIGGFCRETGVCMAGIRLRCSSPLGSREQQLAPQGEGQLAFSHTAVLCTSL